MGGGGGGYSVGRQDWPLNRDETVLGDVARLVSRVRVLVLLL